MLVTGFSGSGKTTLAQQLAEELGLPIHYLDQDPHVKAHFKKPEHFVFNREEPSSQVTLSKMVSNIKKLKTPHIIEGTQVAYIPEYWPGNRLIYVDTPIRQIIRQRLARDRAKGKDVPIGSSNAKERASIAKLLIKEMSKQFDEVINYPEVERMRPNSIFAKALQARKQKEKSESI